jgi:hypothetical protein
MLGEGFQGISLNQLKAGLLFKLFPKPRDKAVIDFKCFHRVSNGQESPGQSAQARADFLDGLCFCLGQGVGDDGGESRLSQKILA